MLAAQKGVAVPQLLERVSDARRRSDALFNLVCADSFYERPIFRSVTASSSMWDTSSPEIHFFWERTWKSPAHNCSRPTTTKGSDRAQTWFFVGDKSRPLDALDI